MKETPMGKTGFCLAAALLAVLVLSSGCVFFTHPGLWSPNEKKWLNEQKTIEIPTRIALIPFYTESGYFYGPGTDSKHFNRMPGVYYIYGALQLLTLGIVFPYAEPLFVTWDDNRRMPPLVLHLDSYALQGLGTELRRHGLEATLVPPDGLYDMKPEEILAELNREEGEFDGLMIVRVSYNRRIRPGLMYHLKSILVDTNGRDVFRYYFYYNNPDVSVWELGSGSGYEFEDGLVEQSEGTRMMNATRDVLMRDFSEFLETFAQIHKRGRVE